jgi:mRNA-degrading endonuclease YafQ of YafQ-DinJ toxin-antitoxin module
MSEGSIEDMVGEVRSQDESIVEDIYEDESVPGSSRKPSKS